MASTYLRGTLYSLSAGEISSYLSGLKSLWNLNMSAKLSGAQNNLSASTSARSQKNWAWARAQAQILQLSASATKFFERTKALLLHLKLIFFSFASRYVFQLCLNFLEILEQNFSSTFWQKEAKLFWRLKGRNLSEEWRSEFATISMQRIRLICRVKSPFLLTKTKLYCEVFSLFFKLQHFFVERPKSVALSIMAPRPRASIKSKQSNWTIGFLLNLCIQAQPAWNEGVKRRKHS